MNTVDAAGHELPPCVAHKPVHRSEIALIATNMVAGASILEVGVDSAAG